MRTEKTVPCRCPVALWERVSRLAKAEGRSGHRQLSLVIERGLRDLAGLEIAALAEERARRLMGGGKPDD